MDNSELRALTEAILLTAAGPVKESEIAEAVGENSVSETEVSEILESIAEELDQPDSGIRLEKVAGGWRTVTAPGLDPYLRSFHGLSARQRLSQAARTTDARSRRHVPVPV